jgi:ATP-dependent Lhr-like helicase
LSPSRKIPGSLAPITFFSREECDWLFANHNSTARSATSIELTEQASIVFQTLKEHGASFLTELVRFTQLPKSEVEKALWELVSTGIVTADGFDSLRCLLQDRHRAGGMGRSGAGRWSLLRAHGESPQEKNIEASCRMLLHRYGVVFRDLIQRETLLPRWRELQVAFRRMEDCGEVRGGRFVSGFVGEQFALPLAVDSLRAIRKTEPSGEIIQLSAADPLNLIGIILPGDRVPVNSRAPLSIRDGVAVELV